MAYIIITFFSESVCMMCILYFPCSQLRFDKYLLAVECIVSENLVTEMPGSPASQDLLQLLEIALEQCRGKGMDHLSTARLKFANGNGDLGHSCPRSLESAKS